jgi:hypothetical protein
MSFLFSLSFGDIREYIDNIRRTVIEGGELPHGNQLPDSHAYRTNAKRSELSKA